MRCHRTPEAISPGRVTGSIFAGNPLADGQRPAGLTRSTHATTLVVALGQRSAQPVVGVFRRVDDDGLIRIEILAHHLAADQAGVNRRTVLPARVPTRAMPDCTRA